MLGRRWVSSTFHWDILFFSLRQGLKKSCPALKACRKMVVVVVLGKSSTWIHYTGMWLLDTRIGGLLLFVLQHPQFVTLAQSDMKILYDTGCQLKISDWFGHAVRLLLASHAYIRLIKRWVAFYISWPWLSMLSLSPTDQSKSIGHVFPVPAALQALGTKRLAASKHLFIFYTELACRRGYECMSMRTYRIFLISLSTFFKFFKFLCISCSRVKEFLSMSVLGSSFSTS